jgi:hypothetical protein
MFFSTGISNVMTPQHHQALNSQKPGIATTTEVKLDQSGKIGPSW